MTFDNSSTPDLQIYTDEAEVSRLSEQVGRTDFNYVDEATLAWRDLTS